jgi:tRNA-uridine 2-sulfurtransferase
MKPKNKTVLLGMSGGVDSSVAALRLKQQGYNVIGAFLISYPNKAKFLDIECPFTGDKELAQKIAKKLKIPFVEIDNRSSYLNKVINPMISEYKKGKTPNPDTYCNKITKFPDLLKKAHELKADFIATGHYANIKKTHKGFQLLQGKDKTKDQSYFLYQLPQSTLSKVLFPNGNLLKSEVRKIAKKNKFPNWDKHGSTGICFLGRSNMKSLLKANIKERPGKVLDEKGNTVGSHPGIYYFTIGERIGPRHNIQINKKFHNLTKSKLFIAEKKKPNTLIIAPKNSTLLRKKKITITKFKRINPSTPIPKSNIKARIRHLGALLPGKLNKKNNKYTFTLKKPQEAIAPGQAIVLYHNQELVAGGEILSTL